MSGPGNDVITPADKPVAAALERISSGFSRPFILRPVATTLLAIAILLAGVVAFRVLAVASLPSVDMPTIRVSATRPGADPATMASTVAAPLERRLGQIAGVTEMTSVNALGSTRIVLQFDLGRSIDGAAQDVQAALNAAAADLPSDMPTLPSFRKANPNAMPVIILAMTSDTMPASAIFDAADTTVVQRIAQIDGVGEVNVSGAEQPAIRVRLDPVRIAAMGLTSEDVRSAIVNANTLAPLGSIDGADELIALDTNAQIRTVDEYRDIIVKTAAGVPVKLGDIAEVVQGTRNSRSSAFFNLKPAVLLMIAKQADANVIETVDRVKELLPELKRWIPAGIDISVLSDRTATIRASVHDMELTLALSIALVMLVVFVFLRRSAPTIAAGITVPLALAGTIALMWVAGFSINNLTLMALAISVGFVVDDAIVMIENVHRNLERGLTPIHTALAGAREIGFTVLAISISLVAAFIPLLFMGGIAGKLLNEFAVTMTFAIAVSTLVSLSVTPMVLAHYVRHAPDRRPSRFDSMIEGGLARLASGYTRTLDVALNWKKMTLLSLVGVIAATVLVFVQMPKGLFPQDDTGLVMASMEGAADTSFEKLNELAKRAVEIVLADTAVESVGSSVGASFFGGPSNSARMFVALKPIEQRGGKTSQQVIDRLRGPLSGIPGLSVFPRAMQDMRGGGRDSKSSYQLTLWGTDVDELYGWVPRVVEAMKAVPGLADVTTDREQGGLELKVAVDKQAAARLGVSVQDIDSALGNAFAQKQVSVIYSARNQYRVILEIDPKLQRDPTDLDNVYVRARDGAPIPIRSVIRTERGLAPLVVNHQGPFPAVTVSYNLAAGMTLDEAQTNIANALARLGAPESLRIEAAGDAKTQRQGAGAQPLLILAALLAVYIVLGVLYESYAHPLTIISTLPSAGLGALLALWLAGMELSMIAFIGIILLIGIVKKNGIMLVDFALDAERRLGLPPLDAIRAAARERFRPILMTSLAAIFGAIPLAIAAGPGAELRRPLGVAIIGGLVVSQILTLYTTPVIYLMLDRLHRKLWGKGAETTAAADTPAEVDVQAGQQPAASST